MNVPYQPNAVTIARFDSTFLPIKTSRATFYLLLSISLSSIFVTLLAIECASRFGASGQSHPKEFVQGTCTLLDASDLTFLSPHQIHICLLISDPGILPQICSDTRITAAVENLLLALSHFRHLSKDIQRPPERSFEANGFNLVRRLFSSIHAFAKLVGSSCGAVLAVAVLHQRVLEWELRQLHVCTWCYQITVTLVSIFLSWRTCLWAWQKWRCRVRILRYRLPKGQPVKAGHVIRSTQPWCVFCLDDLHSGLLVTTRCSHRFHDECLRKWLLKKHICPVCRAPMIRQLPKLNGKTDNTT